jgi:hypothetical protein
MQLADDRTINDLLTREPDACPSRQAAVAPAKARRRRCECGHCPPCLDNLRWQRIFDQKFADPDYYNRSCVPRGSSLDF